MDLLDFELLDLDVLDVDVLVLDLLELDVRPELHPGDVDGSTTRAAIRLIASICLS